MAGVEEKESENVNVRRGKHQYSVKLTLKDE